MSSLLSSLYEHDRSCISNYTIYQCWFIKQLEILHNILRLYRLTSFDNKY